MDSHKARTAKDSGEDTFTKYWPELRGRVQENWSRLTNEWLDDIDGHPERLAEKLRDAYGISEAEANRQVDDFVATHWGAMSAGSMSPGSVGTSNAAGSRGDPANKAETGVHGARPIGGKPGGQG